MIDLSLSQSDPRGALGSVLRRSSEGAACLIGTQAAGKSTFAEYLRLRGTEGKSNNWSLGPRFEEALGGIRLANVRARHVIPLLERVPDALAADGPNIARRPGSKSITVWEPTIASDTERGASFIDVPGEASARIHASSTDPVAEAVRDVIRASDVVVLFVPVWSLLPSEWLVAHAVEALGSHLAATSLIADPRVPPTELELQSVCHHTGVQTDAWKTLLASSVRPGAHLVVVLSQFQQETVQKLFDAFSEGSSRHPLGSEAWRNLDRVYGATPAPAPSWGALPRLAASLRAVDDAAFELIHATRAIARTRGESSGVATALANLVAVPATESVAAARTRARFGSVSVLPLNVVSIQSADDCVRWNTTGHSPRWDPRGCEDVLWTMLLRRHAADLWEP